MISVRAQLAAAVRRVNAAYNRVPNADEIDVFSAKWRKLESDVDTALAAGDDLKARDAIREWEHHALVTFTGGPK